MAWGSEFALEGWTAAAGIGDGRGDSKWRKK